MNVSHTIKDKEIPRWRPLQRLHRLSPPKLSIKRILILLFAAATVLYFFAPAHLKRLPSLTPEESDEIVSVRHRETLKAALTTNPGSLKHTVIFITGQDLYNSAGLAALACEFATRKHVDVLMIFAGLNATESIPFFRQANQFDATSCPIIWHDARHEYSSIYGQASATEETLRHALMYLRKAIVVHVDDEEEWFTQSAERAMYWRRPSVPLIQLKREALPNLKWMAQLTPSALAAWNTPQIDIVITTSDTNTGTLYRLIQSLLSAEYIHPILPRLFITFNPNTTTPAIDRLLREWPADRLIVRHQIFPLHTSFPGAIQSWYPADDHNYALILQDDVELSPWYMYWLHLSLMKYVYHGSRIKQTSTLLTGVSLQSARQPNIYTTEARTLDIRRVLLLAPMYGGWTSYSTPYLWQSTLFHSTLFFPAQWREFHAYIALREHFGGGIPLITDKLEQFAEGEDLALEMYWLELLLARGYAMAYPNFDDGASFAVQHIESPTVEMETETPLVQWGELFEQIDDGLPEWEDLPVLDYTGGVVGWDQLDKTSRRYRDSLSSCRDFPKGAWGVRDLFCASEDEDDATTKLGDADKDEV